MTDRVVMAVDVGTGSARAGLFDAGGRMLARDSRPIAINRPAQGHAEQDSDDIWRAVCAAARAARAEAGVPAEAVAGISFDATCSLVALDQAGRPASVSTSGEARWNVVVWLDHRAIAEAQECTATGHRVLDFVGGTMSPEMEIPKLMWLKRHLPERWRQYGRILDLADFLTWRACGSNARSCCTVTCKWTYLAHETPGWQADFLRTVGLEDLLERAALPGAASPIGAALGPLSPGRRGRARADHRLPGRLRPDRRPCRRARRARRGAAPGEGAPALDRHIGLIAGTSTCHMALAAEPRMVQGVWGPYYGAVAPGLWLNEGGQSVTGALLDHILALHAEGRALGPAGPEAHAKVIARIRELRAEQGGPSRLHVLPDFHGNRSPLADPHALGVISGLTLDASFDSLARLYERTAVGIVLGTRHILDALNATGYAIDHLHITGGHTQNPLLMELYADATGCTVVTAAEADAVLLGTAMVAATAAGLYPDLAERRRGDGARGRGHYARPGQGGALCARLSRVPGDARAAPRAGCDHLAALALSGLTECASECGPRGRPLYPAIPWAITLGPALCARHARPAPTVRDRRAYPVLESEMALPPKKLKKDAIAEALCEVRFECEESTSLPETVVSKLAEFEPWRQFAKVRLAASDIPASLRSQVPNFKNQPLLVLREENGPRQAKIGANVMSYHRLAPYPGWATFKAEIEQRRRSPLPFVSILQSYAVGLPLRQRIHGSRPRNNCRGESKLLSQRRRSRSYMPPKISITV